MKQKKSESTVSTKTIVSAIGVSKFPIIAIGASAGGLEALEQFLSHVPQNSGMAYVVVQHLDPTQKGFLPELLQRVSKMEVLQVKDRMIVAPNLVYVIPPNKSMSILKGRLHLFEPLEARGLRLPIDFFLSSLADDCQEHAVGVILSGMGSDGSAGVRAIKEKRGIVMVQNPATAKFDSMPLNAIDSVVVDIVAPADELPVRLMAFMRIVPVVKPEFELDVQDKSSLEKIIILLRTHTGNDFSLYKRNTLYRRIERRMGIHKIEKISSYVHFLQENPKEVDILFKELLIGVTNFFRDATVWEKLRDEVLPAMLANQPAGTILRAWIPACSTGEEAFSVAIVFKEVLEKVHPKGGVSVQIFATDIDADAIEIARKGMYTANISNDVSPDRLNRFFVLTDDGYRIKTEIREMVVFAQHNIIMHPPFTKVDLLSCRNLLIYMDTELQNKLLKLFYFSLNPEGIMVLGSAETLGAQSTLFAPVDSKMKIFERAVTTLSPELSDFPSSFSRSKPSSVVEKTPDKSPLNIQTIADQILLQYFSPPGVLVNENGDIIYITGRTGKYLEPAVGKANLNIFAMLREGLRTEFPIAFRKALVHRESVVLPHIKVGSNGGSQIINVTIKWLESPEPLHGMLLIVFADVPDCVDLKLLPKNGKKALTNLRQMELEDELQRTREEMQNTLEEMQTSQEELKSTNEELQSTNEELQSTNEELTTSKEEMQSLNEELQTLNAELQSKVDEFSRVNNDMKNLLNSTDIATLFLDKELNIRRFTNQATKIFKLIKSDIGRPFTDQVSDLIYPELVADAHEVLRTLIFIQKQVPTKDGRWFAIRIMPYRTFDDRIDGLVITFINNSDLKKLEVELIEANQTQQVLLDSSSDVVIKVSADLNILEINPVAEKFLGLKRGSAVGNSFIQLFVPESAQKKAESDMNKLLNGKSSGKYSMKIIAAGGMIPLVEWTVKALHNTRMEAMGMFFITKNTTKP